MAKIFISVLIGLIAGMAAFGSIHTQTVSLNVQETIYSDYNKSQVLQSGLSLIFENGLGKASDQFKPTSNASASQKSEFTQAMDTARGNQLEPTTNIKAYPLNASYYPTDPESTCNYACLITRYFYLGLLSITGYNDSQRRQEQIIHEWEPHTPKLMAAIDPSATDLLTGTTDGIIMPTQTPNGFYSPKATFTGGDYPTPTLNIAPTLDATVSQNLRDAIGNPVSDLNKYTSVFGISVVGHKDVPTEHVRYAAHSIAQWLDNQAIGTPNTWSRVVDQLNAVSGSALVLVPNASPQVLAATSLSISSVLNGPNPFNPAIGETTRFQYNLSNDSDVEMHIYSLSGDKVYETKIPRGRQGGNKGFNYTVAWNGRNNHGHVVANGVYLAYFKFDSFDGTAFSKCKVVVYK
ncbi:hypothetical protein N8762_00480 [Candidatus Marinamargulisbacteria bacterium]|nr:hypothetical protein [Candidatus Marinamargulisbacteria bacterium]